MREVDHTVGKALVCLVFFFAAATFPAGAQEVVHLFWPTKIAAEPAEFGPELEPLMPAFRLTAGIVSESALLAMALSQAAMLGITQAEANEMAGPAAKRYEAIAASPVFQKTPSAVTYCFSEKKPATGFANLYLPKQCDNQTSVIVFMHGFAGSYQWYLHIMAEAFPDAIILAPAYGTLPGRMPPEYLFEALEAAGKKTGFPLRTPTLVALSAGVPASFHALVSHPARFESLIAIAGFPFSEDLPKAQAGQRIYFIPGGNEDYTPALAEKVAQLRANGVNAAFDPMPKANHFFLLTRPEESLAKLRAWGLDPENRARMRVR